MGFSPDAELIYGIPIERYDIETSEHSPLWDEWERDWKQLPGDLTIRTYGHYDDPDGPRGILTMNSFSRYMGDAWEPRSINMRSLDIDEQDYREQMLEALEQAGLLDSVPGDMTWWLVASYG